ncbi:MAG: hypothetical protein ACK5PZ_05565 [Pirellula sp.]
MPDSTILYAQIAPVSEWMDHPLREWFVETEAFKKIWRSPEVMKIRGGITVAEFAIGYKLDRLLRDLTEGGVYVAIDRETKGLVVLTKTKGEEWLSKYLDKALDYIRKDAKSKNQPEPLQSAEYRGIEGYKFQNGIFAAIGPWLLITNQGDLAKAVIDRTVEPGLPTLKLAPWTVNADKTGGNDQDGSNSEPGTSTAKRLVNFDIDLATVRSVVGENDLFSEQAKDFGAELLLGGVLSVLRNAPVVAGSLDMDATGISIALNAPSDENWFAESREYYVGPSVSGRAPAALNIDGIATLGTYRNLSEMWLRAGDLFNQNVNDQLAQADNTLTTLFSGKDFGTDILGAIEPELQLIAKQQSFSEDGLHPTVQLPAFALVAKLKKPEVMRRELKRIFQSFVGFLNIVGAQEAQPQLDLSMDQVGNNPIYFAEYIRDADRPYENGLPIQFNFSPTLAFNGDHVILASSVPLARELLDESFSPSETNDSPTNAHTSLRLDAQALKGVLESNENAMITQNMLEKGHSRAEAKREIETLLGVLSLFKSGTVEMSFHSKASMSLRVDALIDPK